MNLFDLKNYNVIFQPQTLLIKEFNNIKKKNKRNTTLTTKEIGFVWFFADIKSDFSIILDETERTNEIKKAIDLPENWKPSKEILEAISFYKQYSKTPSSGLYDASVAASAYIEEKLKDPEKLLSEKDKNDNPIYRLDNVLKMLKDVPDVMEKLHKAKEQVIKEIENQSQLKGSKEKALYEDGI